MGRQGGHRGPIPGVWGLSCAGGSARRAHEWDCHGEWDQAWGGDESAPRQRAGVRGNVTGTGRTCRWQCDACAR